MRWVKFFVSLCCTGALMYILLVPAPGVGIPFAIGRFLSPSEGFWQNAEPQGVRETPPAQIPGLISEVEIVYDERGVPHIFAQKLTDLFRAQGYVTARDRLWQMEFQTLAAAGRLTEVLGRGPENAILELDRKARRMGMTYGAERSLAAAMADPEMAAILQAYTDGVNAYIHSLTPDQLPLEYKLLHYQPEDWTPLKGFLLLKYIGNTLAGGSNDVQFTHALQIWGPEKVRLLYPDFGPDDSPIVPADTRYDKRTALPIPPVPPGYRPDSLLKPDARLALQAPMETADPVLGSNNWAIAASRSSTGYPILANDPHLNLTLPSIWYEMQLKGPGMNVYGVTVPGAPGIQIGFNDSIAWGATSGAMDVMDFFTVTFRDASRREALLDSQWVPVSRRVEAFVIKGEPAFYDTVLYTHAGPVMYDETFGNTQQPLAVSWMGHEASSEMTTYIRLNQAHNYQDYLKAMSYYYGCPSLAFVFASAQGDIAIRQQGKYVLRWPEQGKYVLDGSRSDHLWQQFIPWDQVPAVLNPVRGFVSSANQHPTGAAYPYYYLPVGAFEAYRGRRLNALLAERDTFTPEDMQAMQLDHTGLLAADILPLMLRELDTLSLTQPQRRAWEELRRWDYAYARDKAAPTVFTRWWAEIMTTIWGDEIKAAGMTLRMPSSAVTTRILQDSVRFSFYRTVGDTTRTDRTALINRTFAQMVSKLHQEYPDSRDWAWARRKTTDILHLTRILRPLGRTGLETDGAGGVLNATERTSGPSWRMIVALGPEPRAWAAYPGGQTGNPGSPAYEKFIETWRAGQYYELWFMKNSADPRHPVTSRLQLHP